MGFVFFGSLGPNDSKSPNDFDGYGGSSGGDYGGYDAGGDSGGDGGGHQQAQGALACSAPYLKRSFFGVLLRKYALQAAWILARMAGVLKLFQLFGVINLAVG